MAIKKEKMIVQKSNWTGETATVEYWRIDANSFGFRSKSLSSGDVFLLEALPGEPLDGERSFGYTVKLGDFFGEGQDLVVVEAAFFIEAERPDFACAWSPGSNVEREVHCKKDGNRVEALIAAVSQVLFNIY